MTQRKYRRIYLSEADFYTTYEDKYNIGAHKFILILKTFFYILGQELLEGKVFKLPSGTGLIGVFKKKPVKGTHHSFNYKLFKETGQKSYFKNKHSDDYVLTFDWRLNKNSTDMPVTVRQLYYFEPSRDLKRQLAKKIQAGTSVYKYYDYEQ